MKFVSVCQNWTNLLKGTHQQTGILSPPTTTMSTYPTSANTSTAPADVLGSLDVLSGPGTGDVDFAELLEGVTYGQRLRPYP